MTTAVVPSRPVREPPAWSGAGDDVVTQLLAPIRDLIDRPGVTELCVSEPGRVFLEAHGRWSEIPVPQLQFAHLRSLARAVATWTGQHTDEAAPLLGAPLPTGERIQFVQPSACPARTVVMSIRKPASFLPRLDDLDAGGLFADVAEGPQTLMPFQRELLARRDARDFVGFFRLAVQRHQTIVVAGKTGSGKTTFMKALVEEIPTRERLITIEDAAELRLPNHRNKAQLYYSKNGQGASTVTPRMLLEACLRLRPDRILLAEVRGEEAYHFLRLAASGHPGSITSLHAGSCDEAFDQLCLMVRESAAGSGMTMPEIDRLARGVIDVVVHVGMDAAGRRRVTGVLYDPEARLSAS